MNKAIFWYTLGFLQPYIIGACFGYVSTIFTLIVTGHTNFYFTEKSRKHTHMVNVANNVAKLCNEASTGNFKTPARNREHVNSVLTDLDGVSKDMGIVLNRFVSLWGHIIDLVSQSSDTGVNRVSRLRDLKETMDEIEEKRKILVEWANKIRAG